MDKLSLENYLRRHYPSFYSFAFAMVPEELQAKQIALDAFEVIAHKNSELTNEIIFSFDNVQDEIKSKMIYEYLKHIFSLGMKRYDHLKNGIDIKVNRDEGDFYALGVKERAVLFLKTKLKMSLNDIEFITSLDRYEILTLLGQSRNYLLKKNNGRNITAPEIIGS